MAKIRFYCDIFPGQWPQFGLMASTSPAAKGLNCRRLAFDVVVSDQVLIDVDSVSPEPAIAAVVDERET